MHIIYITFIGIYVVNMWFLILKNASFGYKRLCIKWLLCCYLFVLTTAEEFFLPLKKVDNVKIHLFWRKLSFYLSIRINEINTIVCSFYLDRLFGSNMLTKNYQNCFIYFSNCFIYEWSQFNVYLSRLRTTMSYWYSIPW